MTTPVFQTTENAEDGGFGRMAGGSASVAEIIQVLGQAFWVVMADVEATTAKEQ